MDTPSACLELMRSLLSDDPQVRRNQIIFDSSEAISLSDELRLWLKTAQLGTLTVAEQVDLAFADPSLSQEAKKIFSEWAPHAKKSYDAGMQRLKDKEEFERKTRKLRNASVKSLRELGLGKNESERVYQNHLMLQIAYKLGLRLKDIRGGEDQRKELIASLKKDFYPYDASYVPFLDIGWFCLGRVYGPTEIDLDLLFEKAPFPLERNPATLYLVKIDMAKLGYDKPSQWKVGITQRSVLGNKSGSRFSGKTRDAISVSRSIRFSDARDAFFLEQKIIKLSSYDSQIAFRGDDEKLNALSKDDRHNAIRTRKAALTSKMQFVSSRDLKSHGIGPSEWVWEGRDDEYVESSFDRVVAYAPYFGEIIDECVQFELDL